MALSASLVKRDKTSGVLTAVVRITASGSYSTNGDSLDLAPIAGWTNKQPDFVRVVGNSGFIYSYDRANKKVIVLGQNPTSATAGVIALSELAAGAYPAGITGDVIDCVAMWFR